MVTGTKSDAQHVHQSDLEVLLKVFASRTRLAAQLMQESCNTMRHKHEPRVTHVLNVILL